MCGRYYVDDETAREIERNIRIADEKVRKATSTGITLQAKDIHPTDLAPILMLDLMEREEKMKMFFQTAF